jgi:hypothetical protein
VFFLPFATAPQMGATGTSAVLERLKNPVSVPLFSSCGCGFGFSSGYPYLKEKLYRFIFSLNLFGCANH